MTKYLLGVTMVRPLDGRLIRCYFASRREFLHAKRFCRSWGARGFKVPGPFTVVGQRALPYLNDAQPAHALGLAFPLDFAPGVSPAFDAMVARSWDEHYDRNPGSDPRPCGTCGVPTKDHTAAQRDGCDIIPF